MPPVREPLALRSLLLVGLPLESTFLNVALVGARTPGEVEANMTALDVEFDDDALKAIDAVFERNEVDTKPDVWVE